MVKLKRSAWEKRDRGGQFKTSARCDCCGRPVGSAYFTDDEVCGTGDGPGFYVCERKSCVKLRAGKTVEERRAIYTATRAALALSTNVT